MSSIVNDNDNDNNNNVIFNFSNIPETNTNTNNTNTNNNNTATKTFYKPPKNSSNNNSQDVRNIPKLKQRIKKTLAIGDSFIGIFKLLKPESNVKIEKIKGGTAKGIYRIG